MLVFREINNLCLVNKKCLKICENEEFWKRRLIKQYGIFDKNDGISWRDLYRKYYNSGDLHIIKRKTGNLMHVIKNVRKFYLLGKVVMYIDINDDLYVIGNTDKIPNNYAIRYHIDKQTYDVPHLLKKESRMYILDIRTHYISRQMVKLML